MPTSITSREQLSQQRERANEASRLGHEELRAAARAWDHYIDVLMSTFCGHRRGEAALADIIDSSFDMAHHLLDAQRQFTKSLLPMTTSVLNATYSAAEEATRATREAARATTSPRETPAARKAS
jgi:hypothetical protein